MAGLAGQVNLGHAAFFGLGALVTRTLWIGRTPVVAAMAAGAAARRGRRPRRRAGRVPAARRVLRDRHARPRRGAPDLRRQRAAGDLDAAGADHRGLSPRAALLRGPRAGARRRSLAVACARPPRASASACRPCGRTRRPPRRRGSSAFAGQARRPWRASTGLAGLAGGLFAYYHISYYPQHPFSPTWTFDAVLMTFIGGVGTVHGPVLGAALLRFAEGVAGAAGGWISTSSSSARCSSRSCCCCPEGSSRRRHASERSPARAAARRARPRHRGADPEPCAGRWRAARPSRAPIPCVSATSGA